MAYQNNRRSNPFNNGNPYDDNPYDDFADWDDRPVRTSRRRRSSRNGNGNGNRNGNGYTMRDGDTVRLVIQTPADMLPPMRRSPAELNRGNWPVNRSGFRERF